MEQTVTVDLWQLLLGIVGLLFTLLQFLSGWFVKSLFQRIEAVESVDKKVGEKLEQILIQLPTNYVSKPDHSKALDDIHGAIRRIEDRLSK